MLINTRHHGDHTSGNGAFRPVVKRMLAHENCVIWQRKVAEEAAAKPPAPGAPAPAAPVVAPSTFKDTWSVDFGNEKVHVRYFGPGHTSGVGDAQPSPGPCYCAEYGARPSFPATSHTSFSVSSRRRSGPSSRPAASLTAGWSLRF
jgi:hypothetical protein